MKIKIIFFVSVILNIILLVTLLISIANFTKENNKLTQKVKLYNSINNLRYSNEAILAGVVIRTCDVLENLCKTYSSYLYFWGYYHQYKELEQSFKTAKNYFQLKYITFDYSIPEAMMLLRLNDDSIIRLQNQIKKLEGNKYTW